MHSAACFRIGFLAVLAVCSLNPVPARSLQAHTGAAAGLHARAVSAGSPDAGLSATDPERIRVLSEARWRSDLAAMKQHRPSYPFWQHVFTTSDGSVAFGAADDGRLLGVVPNRGDWGAGARWEEPGIAEAVHDLRPASRLTDRREQWADRLEEHVGPVVHNATRGDFLLPNVERVGEFLEEWGRIYERFGVPAELGLAQAAVESGFDGRIRSEAGALGLCQWMPRNWDRLKQLSPFEIEGYNQTTQVGYCAAYLTVLATKYGSFIPALSEHHAGGTNVGRTVINGGRLGGEHPREQYFLGASFARDLREISRTRFRDLVRTYGPRSYLYAEMIFGNTVNVARFAGDIPQTRIHAMRASRPLPIEDVARRTGLSIDELRRYNPSLVRQVPRGAALYLPFQVDAFGPDIAFWHRPPEPAFVQTLAEFMQIDLALHEWDDPAFGEVLREFRTRFARTDSEEGVIMATVLAWVMEETWSSRRGRILDEFRSDPEILRLVREGMRERATFLDAVGTAR